MSELDTRIALLLGWTRYQQGDWPVWRNPEGVAFDEPPAYSTSLDAHQEILAGLRERGWRITIEDEYQNRPEAKWSATLTRWENGMIAEDAGEYGETAAEASALAICAALESEAKNK